MKGLLKDKKVIIIGAVIILALVIAFLVFVLGGNGSNENNENNTTSQVGVSEQDIKDAYNFSGADAINLVKTIFNGDSFNFTYSINNESKYVVTAKSRVEGDNTVLKFIVDPITKSFYEED